MTKAKSRKNPKISSIEGLAVLIVEQIATLRLEMHSRFDTLEEVLRKLDSRISALEMKVSGIYRQFSEDKMHQLDVKHLMNRVAKLENKVFKK